MKKYSKRLHDYFDPVIYGMRFQRNKWYEELYLEKTPCPPARKLKHEKKPNNKKAKKKKS